MCLLLAFNVSGAMPKDTVKPGWPELSPIKKITNNTMTMYQAADFKHFTLVHHTKRRVRIIAPSLGKDLERAYPIFNNQL